MLQPSSYPRKIIRSRQSSSQCRAKRSVVYLSSLNRSQLLFRSRCLSTTCPPSLFSFPTTVKRFSCLCVRSFARMNRTRESRFWSISSSSILMNGTALSRTQRFSRTRPPNSMVTTRRPKRTLRKARSMIYHSIALVSSRLRRNTLFVLGSGHLYDRRLFIEQSRVL